MFIVAEDCEAHSLLKGQSLKLEEIGDDDEAWKREHGRKDDKGDDDNKLQEPKLSEQQTRKQRTLLKLMAKGLQPKKVAKVLKKDQQGKEITVRHVSLRNKDSDKR